MFKLGWGTAQTSRTIRVGTPHNINRTNPGAGWVGWSNQILEPTLALIRAQLGFRIKVRAECGNISGREMSEREMF